MAISLIVHLAIFAVARQVEPFRPTAKPADAARAEVRGDWIRVQRVAVAAPSMPEAEPPEADEPVEPIEVEQPEQFTVLPPEEPEPAVPADASPRPSVADRLRLQVHDPRLWDLRPPDRPEPRSSEELLRESVLARIGVLNDSAQAALAAQERALDWTVRTEDGGRWGISPEGIHLGSVTLPAPAFAPPPGRRDEINARMLEWSEIRYQAQRAEVRATFDERVRAIREMRQTQPPDSTIPPR